MFVKRLFNLTCNFRVNALNTITYKLYLTYNSRASIIKITMDTLSDNEPRQRSYSDADKAKALIALDLNGGNVKYTAEQLNLPRKTLATWKDGNHINEDVVSIRHNKTQELANKFEDLANIYINQAVLTVDKATGTNAITGAGIAVDKMRLLRGESTANIAVLDVAKMLNNSLQQARDLHLANPDKYPLPTRQEILESYEATCQKNGIQPDYDAIDLSVLDVTD